MPKESAARIQTSNLQACRHPDHYATGTLPSRNFAFPFSLLPWLQRAGFRMGCSCEKSIFHIYIYNYIYIYISEFQPEVPFPRPSDTAVPPDLQAHRIRVASRPGQVPGTSPANLVYDTPVEVRADPAVGVGDLHRMPVETVRVKFFARVRRIVTDITRCRAWQMCSGA